MHHQTGQEGLTQGLVFLPHVAGELERDVSVRFAGLYRRAHGQHVVDGGLHQADGAGEGGAENVRLSGRDKPRVAFQLNAFNALVPGGKGSLTGT